jgi:biotin transport system substrate-specific component
LSLVTGLGWGKALSGTLFFVPGDLVKAVLAALICQRIEALIRIDRH